MTFGESISTCFSKYAAFDGRASRSEYWWWFLFTFLASAATGIISETLSALFSLAVLLPSLAVGARRLHDTNRSAWFLLLWMPASSAQSSDPRNPRYARRRSFCGGRR